MDKFCHVEAHLDEETKSIFKSYQDSFLKKENMQLRLQAEMSEIANKTEYFRHFYFFDENNLQIGTKLKIHPMAFHQLTLEEKENVLSFSADCNTLSSKDVLKQPCYSITQRVKQKYNILFIEEQSQYVKQKLNVDLDNYFINGRAIFKNLKPYEINRLYKLILQLIPQCKKAKNQSNSNIEPMDSKDYLLQAAKAFAEYEKVDNVADFCATGEFAVILIRKEAVEKNPKNKNKKKRQEEQKNIADELCSNDCKKQAYSDEYLKIKEICPQDDGIRFSSLCTAATHYMKHGKTICLNEQIEVSPKGYVELIRDSILSNPCQLTLTQDGNSLVHNYCFKLKERLYRIILLKKVTDNTLIVATFFQDKK